MKYFIIALLTATSFLATRSFAQDMAFDYQYSVKDKCHYVVNIPKDSTYHQWGIWKSVAAYENGMYTMKMFMKKHEVLFLKYFQGVAEIILDNNESIPINVYWEDEDDAAPVTGYEKELAFQFSKSESDILLEHQIKKILFYTTYGKLTVVFSDSKMIQKALQTLKYNINIYNEATEELLSETSFTESSP